ncbi:hypothetical protein FJT64_008054 [Amphibalanus amphitrite]|uniref:G-protein coupled receptors family 1 profile domain-containing protein n=1 Tax=Amphibalanus amphitrite TaxID=1232801 RepID=A0A6A4VIJ5_AMPAM|nr:hypothetical protein FJT64_008054 [Amphibalanus amphitrite]
MILLLMKVLVGLLLMAAFSLPLTVIVVNIQLLDEPMSLLVFNMTLIYYVFGVSFFLIGMTDVLYPEGVPPPVCAAAMHFSMAMAVGLKVAALSVAVDQFIGVVHSLRYYAIMDVWKWKMVFLTWFCMAMMVLFCLACYLLDLETSDEYFLRLFGIQPSNEECRMLGVTHLTNIVLEVVLLVTSLSSAVLFIHTAIQGVKQERRIASRNIVDTSSRFFVRFKSFKRIVKLLLTVLALDILGTGFRIARSWNPQMSATQLVHLVRVLCLILEGWTYGLSSPAVRAAFRSFFGCIKRQTPVSRIVPGNGLPLQVRPALAWQPSGRERF